MASIRLHSIRDGLEEYEILNELEENYAAKGYDADGILQTLYKKLYSNAQVNGEVMEDTSIFSETREELMTLGQMNQTFGAYIGEVAENSTEVRFTVAAEKDVKVKLNGQTAEPVAENGGLYEYECVVRLDQDENAFRMELERDGKSMVYTHSLGGKSVLFNAVETEEDAKLFTAEGGTVSLVSASVMGSEGNALRVDLPAATEKTSEMRFTTSFDALKTASSLAVEIYNPSDINVPLVIYVDTSGSDILRPVYSGTLLHGKTVAELSFADFNWSSYGDAESLVFRIGSIGDAAKTLYFDNFVLKG